MNRLGAIIRLAWRDIRAQPTGFRLYASALGLGIGAMVAVASFRDSMERALDLQTRALLGADLAVRARRAFSDEAREFLGSVPGEYADEIQFRTMAWFPESEKARFVQVRAIEAAYPFYGRLDAAPSDAAAGFHAEAYALVEENALIQAGADIGARIRLGKREFTVRGRLLRAPGESPSEAFIAPRVYIPLRFVEETGLLLPGSIVSYRRYFKLPEGVSAQEWQERIKQRLPRERLEIETAETRKQSLLGAVDPIARYLGLVGFVGLLLGCVGVAGSAHTYVTRRLLVIAMLRCIGATRGFSAWVFLVQALALGAAGAAVGAFLAAMLLPLVAAWMSGFLAAEVTATLNMRAVAQGVAAGLLFCAGFAALPLIAVRKVSPAQALTRFSTESTCAWRDPARLGIGAILLAAVIAFAAMQSGSLKHGAGLAGGMIAAFAALLFVARALRAAARMIAARVPWLPARHGVACLYRPDNQTGVMLSALGLGACLLATLHVAERSLRAALTVYREPDQPTIVLIDVQPDQRAAVAEAIARAGFPPLNETPIIAMRLDRLAGRGVEDVLRDPARQVPEWALRREYRGTYRAAMFPTEKLLAGAWIPRWNTEASPDHGAVPISLEKSIAQTLAVGLDDEIVWDVQGLPLRTRVKSIRDVDWRSMKPNFYVVFPEGPLNAAPQTWALFARASDAGGAADVQRIVADQFPNVSVIDLALVLSSVNAVLGRLGEAARGIAWFALAAGALVVAGAVRANREQREREWVLMRTLGASARHLVAVSIVEHSLLGLLGGLAGVSLGMVSGGIIARELMQIDPVYDARILALGVLSLALMTAALGFVAARPRNSTPLELAAA